MVSMDEIAVKLREILETIQSDMYDRAKDFLDTHIYTATSLDEMKEEFTKKRGFVKACWCGDPECEGEVKYVTGGAATRCLIEDEEFVSDKCIWCGKDVYKRQEFAVRYINQLLDGLADLHVETIVHICGHMKNVYKEVREVHSNALSFDSAVPKMCIRDRYNITM